MCASMPSLRRRSELLCDEFDDALLGAYCFSLQNGEGIADLYDIDL